ncbi:general secretion pathway protein G [Collimonas sp. PA-H2]|uniref:type II secretion system protein n=1 Tax=Collimonas sp. PA-H2 TaxID=1881062 RepID=UPI000BF6B6BE|nr:prepilin-type N-terminal cleavage/methylation domain-containing protein [Collimonas sp. PA-H2]PFH08584.1 general secretion pathway protein G [Collimonas sp. PA-H2]
MLRPSPLSRSKPPGWQSGGNRHGFTLIEMVIVMAVIGLLLTLAVPRYFVALDNGKVKVQQQNLATMRDALDKFFGDQGRYPETLEELVQKHYLRSVPVDPVTESPNWIAIAPVDPALSGVYDVRSAAKAAESENVSATTN